MIGKYLIVAGLLAVPFVLPAEEAVATVPQPASTELGTYAKTVNFVTRTYIHGIPYGEARDLGPAALPVLEELLETEKMKAHWANIVTVIAFIGEPQARETLNHFVRDRFVGEVDLPTFQAMIVAQGLLGHVNDPILVSELIEAADPAHWDSLPWSYQTFSGDPLSLLWSKLSINSLAYTGTVEAEEFLGGLQAAPYHPRQQSNIDEGLERMPTIRTMGIEAFERMRDENRGPHNH